MDYVTVRDQHRRVYSVLTLCPYKLNVKMMKTVVLMVLVRMEDVGVILGMEERTALVIKHAPQTLIVPIIFCALVGSVNVLPATPAPNVIFLLVIIMGAERKIIYTIGLFWPCG